MAVVPLHIEEEGMDNWVFTLCSAIPGDFLLFLTFLSHRERVEPCLWCLLRRY